MLGKREIEEMADDKVDVDDFSWILEDKRKRIVSECLFRHKYRVDEPKTPQIK